MKKNGRIILFGKALLFSAVFAVMFKWLQVGNPFQSSTIILGVIILIQMLVSLYISKRFRFFSRMMSLPVRKLKKQMVPYFILFLVIILFVCLIIIGVSIYGLNLIMGNDTTHLMQQLFEQEYPVAIKSYSVFALIVSVYFFYKVWRQAIEKEQQLREENLRFRYRTLKTQVNPHFLFNSLNTLSEIVYTDARQSDNYIQKLAGIYRYILNNEETDLVPLPQEIEFVNHYFELQKERDDDKIELEINIPDSENYNIIPVSLQILVENALKHNSASGKSPLKLHIIKEGMSVVISNNIQRKDILDDSHGTGLANLKERAKLITGREIVIEQKDDKFIVKLPIISI